LISFFYYYNTFREENVSQFAGVFRHEFDMSVRRRGLWLAYSIVFAFFVLILIREGLDHMYSGGTPWQEAGETVYMLNMLAPLIGGILAADRMKRDSQLGVRELQISAPFGHTTYILSKYAGVLLSVLLPMFLWVLALSTFSVAMGLIAPTMIGSVVVAFVAIAIPSFAFVIAFSLACPLIMPVRVYQILFTGYWFWGNYLSDEVFPTISGTLLNASGVYAQQGLFGGTKSQVTGMPLHTATEAWLNILVLGLCVAAVLFALNQYLDRQSRQA
jgi:ABC-type transport system involved in multi-copper enzyme maturation permease subunit